MINQNFGIAIHILLYLKNHEGTYKTSKDLAESINTNPVIVRNILAKLKKEKYVITKKGRYGTKINSDVKNITFYDVYKLFYDDIGINTKHTPNPECALGVEINKSICLTLNKVNQNLINDLKKYRVYDLINKIEEED